MVGSALCVFVCLCVCVCVCVPVCVFFCLGLRLTKKERACCQSPECVFMLPKLSSNLRHICPSQTFLT